jgi:CDP-glucose 4,6-dehydratase
VGKSLISSVNSINEPVLITGHTGFKGSWMTQLLDMLGIEWVGLSLQPKPESLYKSINQKNKREYFADIRNYEHLKKIINTINPKYVIHLAAQPLVLNSYIEPRETFETNVLGTVNLLDALVTNSSTSKIVVATTDKVYKQKKIKRSFNESDSLGGKDPYSWSKVGTEAVIGAWQQISKTQGGPKIISVRAGNVIGGGDSSQDRLLPDLIKGFISNSCIEIRNPKSTRPWQHALDPLSGYLLALATDTKATAFNFSPNSKSLRVEKVTKIAQTAWGDHSQVNFGNIEDTLETKSLSLKSVKAKKELKWHSIWTQEESVVSTVEWWKNVTKKSLSPSEACMKDISELLDEF